MDFKKQLENYVKEERRRLFYLNYVKEHVPMTEQSLNYYEIEIEKCKTKIDSFEYFLNR